MAETLKPAGDSTSCLAGLDLFSPVMDRETPGGSWAFNQRMRRSTILAKARHMIGVVGWKNVMMRDLAAGSGVAMQTLYNMFSDRGGLLCHAVCDDMPRMAHIAMTMPGYDHAIYAYVDLSCHYAQRWSLYFFDAIRYNLPFDQHYGAIQASRIDCVAAIFDHMKAQGRLRQDVQSRTLADSAVMLMCGSAMEWIDRKPDFKAMQQEMRGRVQDLVGIHCTGPN